MHPLLIREEIIQELTRQLRVSKKHYKEATIPDLEVKAILLSKGIKDEDIGKQTAFLVVEDYIELGSVKPGVEPMYIKVTKKGVSAAASNYFKEQHKQMVKESWRYWIEIPSQFVVGAAAIIALFMSAGKCNTEKPQTNQTPQVTINNIIGETRQDSSRQTSILDTLSKP